MIASIAKVCETFIKTNIVQCKKPHCDSLLRILQRNVQLKIEASFGNDYENRFW
jgi:hypothetical protein